jgi:hypothetical protein
MHGKLFMIRKKDVDARRSSELRRIINRKNVDKLKTYLFVQKTADFHFAISWIYSSQKWYNLYVSVFHKKQCYHQIVTRSMS